MALEEHYGLTFEADEIPNLVSVRKIRDAIQRRVATA
jgi:acyl carrier protein